MIRTGFVPRDLPESDDMPEARYARMVEQNIRFCQAIQEAHPELTFGVSVVPCTDNPRMMARATIQIRSRSAE